MSKTCRYRSSGVCSYLHCLNIKKLESKKTGKVFMCHLFYDITKDVKIEPYSEHCTTSYICMIREENDLDTQVSYSFSTEEEATSYFKNITEETVEKCYLEIYLDLLNMED